MSERSGRHWPWGIAAVLALTVAGNAAVYWAANDGNAAAVEPDYYRKAVEWDSTMAQERRNRVLGWSADAALGARTADGGREVSIRVSDGAGHPVPAARVELTAIHNAFAATPAFAESVTDSAGAVHLDARLGPAGLWELRVVVTRGADRYTTTLHRDTKSGESAGVMALIGSILAASLLGSPHCAAMCGGFACFYAGEPGTARNRLALVAYNGGRLVFYAFLGALAGGLGAGVNTAGRIAGAARPAAVLAGLLMVSWGTVTILHALGVRLPRLAGLGPARRLLQGVLQRMHRRPPVARAAALGLLTTLLPCGWLYVFVATAAGTASPWRGALVMAVFWVGTVPVLAGLGLAVQRMSGPLRQRLPVMTAAVLVVIGLLTAAGRIGAGLGTPSPEAHLHAHR